MTTRQRTALLSKAHSRLFPRTELIRLIRAQLGHVDALDRQIARDGVCVQARAPKLIFHICAGNLAVSAWTSIAHGLLLGARNVVKLPSQREDRSTRVQILHWIGQLPKELRRLVETTDDIFSPDWHQADVIIAFGSDTTMAELRGRTRWDQKFIVHGHAVSLLWLPRPNHLNSQDFASCAIDVLTYDQLGCLSPQVIYAPRGTNFDGLGTKLGSALEAHWQKTKPKPARDISVAARIVEARDVAHALGHRVWLPDNHLGWTVIHDPNSPFAPSPLHGVIYLRGCDETGLEKALRSVRGRISTVGVAGKLSSRSREAFLKLGVSRFCPAGHMQFPPLTWHHDGKPTLGDLVTWIDFETAS